MRKANSLHADIAAYRVQQAEKWAHAPLMTAKSLASTFEVRPLLKAIADQIGSAKLAAIASDVADIEDQREREGVRCRRKVSERQSHALAIALLERYDSPRGIVKAAWNLTDQQIDEAQV